MADYLYGRRAKLTIALPLGKSFSDTDGANQIEIDGGDDPASPGMRIQFMIAKTDQKEPNTSQVTITNLSLARRSSLQQKGMKVTLDAGYVSTGISRLFFGDSRTTDHLREGPDWNTVIRLGDGERSFRFARYAESFSPGVGAADVLRALAQATGLSLGNSAIEAANITTSFDHGYSVSGPVSKSLDRLLKSLGYGWSIQDGGLQILLPNASVETVIPEITPETGLIGSPEMGAPEKKGKPGLLKFTALIYPTRPGGQVKLRSDRYNGILRVKKCRFEGDTHGGPWYTHVEGVVIG